MLAVLLAIVTATAPTPSPTSQPLQTIVIVRTSPFCGAFASHVNSAISSAVDNDKSLGSAMMTLRSRDLANNDITRNNELHQLQSLADQMYRAYRDGEAEVNRLRDLAKTAKDKDEAAQVTSSADALGGVLYRQHLIQRDLDGFVAFLQAGDMRRDLNDEMVKNSSMMGGGDTVTGARFTRGDYWIPPGFKSHSFELAGDESWNDDVDLAGHAVTDFQTRLPAIVQDEVTAGGRIAQANERC